MVISYIGLGSNTGNRKKNIEKACLKIAKLPKTSILLNSPLYDTTPVGPKQRNFINGALKLRTFLRPAELLSELKGIEKEMGRKRTKRWAPRVIDLDILFYGEKTIRTRNLKVPHPELLKRMFVIRPLTDIASRKLTKSFPLTIPGQKVRIVSK
jgi:2-amino-4-hydroxy-6-hydroxymethyldihydropteridine diphosphokinase